MAQHVKNVDLYNELVKCLDASTGPSPELIDMWYKMIKKFSHNFTYVYKEDREDCEAFAMLDLYSYWTNFNPKYKNAFAYITQLIKNGMAKGWKKMHPIPVSKFTSLSYNDIWNL